MTTRRIKIDSKSELNVAPCPKCQNKDIFIVHSEQVAEDGCEVWAVCNCGYDPTETDSDYRMESVMGGCDNLNCIAALECWNDAIRDSK